jgi:hypothetical protein
MHDRSQLLQRIESLPERDQRVVIRLINWLGGFERRRTVAR